MQKISSYLYPNRIQLLVDESAFTVEYTNVFQRSIKLYNGIDNIIEFDIKNADQKRIDLMQFDILQLNVMDINGKELNNSPYEITRNAKKGIGVVTIPQEDLYSLTSQNLKYSVSGVKDQQQILFYCDTNFNATGTIEVVGDAMPTFRNTMVYDTFIAEIDIKGVPIYHSSAIPAKFYEAEPVEFLSFDIDVSGFVGSIWIEATTNSTINMDAFKDAGRPFGSWTRQAADGLFTGIIPYGSRINVGDYNYFRVSYQTPSYSGHGAIFLITKENNEYTLEITRGGTGYSIGSMIRVKGGQLGGIDGINDLFITVTHVQGVGSSYTVSSISGASVSGVASDGTGSYSVSGENYTGVVNKVSVN